MKNKIRILIIGNQGYVGSVLSNQLNDLLKFETFGLDVGIFSRVLIEKNPDKKIKKQTFCDVRKIKKNHFRDIDVVVYLAAISNDPMGNRFKQLTYQINQKSCLKAAKLAKEGGVKRFIFASSCSVYGQAGNANKKETDKVEPLTAYAKSKINSEKLLKKISSKKFKVVSLRFATACGHSPRLRLDLVLNDFITNAILFKKIKILSDGKSYRPLISVENMSKIMIYFSDLDKKLKKNFYIINAGLNDWNFSIIQLAKRVSKIINNIPVEVGNSHGADKRSYKVNFSYLKKLTPGLKLNNNLNSTIREMYQAIKKIKFKSKNFRESKFIRLKILEKFIQKNDF